MHRSITGFVGLFAVTTATIVATNPSAAHIQRESSEHQLIFDEELSIPENNLSRPLSDQQALGAAAELFEFNKDKFLGVYFDDNLGKTVIIAANEDAASLAGIELAEHSTMVQIERSQWSFDSMEKLADELERADAALDRQIVGYAVSADFGGISLFVDEDLTADSRSLVEQFAEKEGVRIGLISSRNFNLTPTDTQWTDPSPYAGALRYGRAEGATSSTTLEKACSGAFGFRESGTDYMLTAGHCMPRGIALKHAWIFSGSTSSPVKHSYAGERAGSTWEVGTGTVAAGDDQGLHGDVAIIDVSTAGRTVGNKIFWGSPNTSSKIPVIARRVPIVGDPVAFNGFVSGADRGMHIVKTNTKIDNAPGVATRRVDVAVSNSMTDCPYSGDSGGSVILDTAGAEDTATAIGVVSSAAILTYFAGVQYDCVMGFTGIEEAIQAWGVSLYTY